MGRDLGLRPQRERAASGPDRSSLRVPNLAGLGIDRDSPERRRAQLFARQVIAAVEAWRHRQMRRAEGFRP